MRTTVTIDPDVQALVKWAMRDRDASFKVVRNEDRRQALSSPLPRRTSFKQATFSLGRPLVDLTKATALASELEDIELAARLRQGR